MNKYVYNVQVTLEDGLSTVLEVTSDKQLTFADFLREEFVEIISTDKKMQQIFRLADLRMCTIQEKARCEDIEADEDFKVGDCILLKPSGRPVAYKHAPNEWFVGFIKELDKETGVVLIVFYNNEHVGKCYSRIQHLEHIKITD